MRKNESFFYHSVPVIVPFLTHNPDRMAER